MKKIAAVLSVIFALASAIAFTSFAEDKSTCIRLRVYPNYQGDTISSQKTGLLWALSYLGAELPKHSFEQSLKRIHPGIYELDIGKAGFDNRAILAFKKLIAELKSSGEYTAKGGIDLGEFVVYTLGSSWHYYEITGAAPSFEEYTKRSGSGYDLVFPVLSSDVAYHHRLIKMRETSEVLKMSFIAEEGTGDLDRGTFKASTYEVFDIMKNGQLRFAVYGHDGRLKAASEAEFGRAGKPVKCLWCHEINIQPLFTRNDSVKGFMSPAEFQRIISARKILLDTYRKTLNGDVDFTKTQDHAFMELLYITFMEPSIFKLAGEWGQDPIKLMKRFERERRHPHREYSFLPDLMERAAVKKHSPYTTVPLPDSIWAENALEPNLFKRRH